MENSGISSLASGWSLSLSNAAQTELSVWLEPWCDEFPLAPRGELTLIIEADEGPPDEPELEISENVLTVWAAAGTRIRVQIDGIEHESASAGFTTPDMGTLSMRGFVDVVFGDFPEARPGGRPAPTKRNWFRRLFVRN